MPRRAPPEKSKVPCYEAEIVKTWLKRHYEKPSENKAQNSPLEAEYRKRILKNRVKQSKDSVDKAALLKYQSKQNQHMYGDKESDLVRSAQSGINKVLRQREKAGASSKDQHEPSPQQKRTISRSMLKRKAPPPAEGERSVSPPRKNFIEMNIRYVREMSGSHALALKRPKQEPKTVKEIPQKPLNLRYSKPAKGINNVFFVKHGDGDVSSAKPRPRVVKTETRPEGSQEIGRRYLRDMKILDKLGGKEMEATKKENDSDMKNTTASKVVLENDSDMKNTTANIEQIGDLLTMAPSRNAPTLQAMELAEGTSDVTKVKIAKTYVENIGDSLTAEEQTPKEKKELSLPLPATPRAADRWEHKPEVRVSNMQVLEATVAAKEEQKVIAANVMQATPQEAVVFAKPFLRKGAGARAKELWTKKKNDLAKQLPPSSKAARVLSRTRRNRLYAGVENPKAVSVVARVPLEKLVEKSSTAKPNQGVEKTIDGHLGKPKPLLPKKPFVFNPHLAEPKNRIIRRKKEKPWKPIWGSNMTQKPSATKLANRMLKNFTPNRALLDSSKSEGIRVKVFKTNSFDEAMPRQCEKCKKKLRKRRVRKNVRKQVPVSSDEDSEDSSESSSESSSDDTSEDEKKKVKRKIKKKAVLKKKPAPQKAVAQKTRRLVPRLKNVGADSRKVSKGNR